MLVAVVVLVAVLWLQCCSSVGSRGKILKHYVETFEAIFSLMGFEPGPSDYESTVLTIGLRELLESYAE